MNPIFFFLYHGKDRNVFYKVLDVLVLKGPRDFGWLVFIFLSILSYRSNQITLIRFPLLSNINTFVLSFFSQEMGTTDQHFVRSRSENLKRLWFSLILLTFQNMGSGFLCRIRTMTPIWSRLSQGSGWSYSNCLRFIVHSHQLTTFYKFSHLSLNKNECLCFFYYRFQFPPCL